MGRAMELVVVMLPNMQVLSVSNIHHLTMLEEFRQETTTILKPR